MGCATEFRFLARKPNFSLHHFVQTRSEASPASDRIGTGRSFSGVKAAGGAELTTHLLIVPTLLRICGAIHPLPHGVVLN
jgi:hypothetical protein